MTDVTGLVNVATSLLPSILAMIRENHAQAHPGAPPLTDADVFAALAQAVESSVAKDETWKAQHPGDMTGEVPAGSTGG